MTTAPEADKATDRPLDEAGAEGMLDGNLSRRRMMRNAALTAGTVVAAGAGLAACSSGSGASGSGSSGSGSSGSGNSSGGAGGGNTVLGKTSDIPVGGGVIYSDDKVVVTQPTAGDFKAFSATCTHLGCTVNKIANGLIMCPCHGSRYSVTDGSVKGGPAPKPLPPETITVKNGQVTLNG